MLQPLLASSKLLLGTPLDDAADTQVGSIMPKFEYKEYVELPRSMVDDALSRATPNQPNTPAVSS